MISEPSSVEGVGASSPPSEEQAKSNGFEYPGDGTDGDGIKGAFLGEDLGHNLKTID